eukprot:gene14494-17105_t
MTRICVKQLPKHVNEKRLRDHFSKFGDVTDCKIMKTSDGKSRMFGFVGFASEEATTKALTLNNTFFDTSKIAVERAIATTDASSLSRPWSKYSSGSSSHDNALKEAKELEAEEKRRKEEKEKEKERKDKEKKDKKDNKRKKSEVEEELKGDEQFEQFKSLMQSRVNRKMWANDDDDSLRMTDASHLDQDGRERTKKRRTEDEMVVADKTMFDDENGEDDDLYDDMPKISKKKEESEDEEDLEAKKRANDSAVSDLDWLRSKVSSKAPKDDDSEDEEDDEDESMEEDSSEEEEESSEEEVKDKKKKVAKKDDDDKKTKKDDKKKETEKEKEVDKKDDKKYEFEDDYKAEEEKPENNVGETGRLFIRNLAYTTTEDDLKNKFETYGKLSEVYVPIDKTTKKSKGIAFLLFMVPENAMRAMTELDNTILQGRIMHVLPAKNAPVKEIVSEENSSYKQQKDREMKAASANTYNWNSLFMRSDAIVSSLAERYKLSQGEILDPNAVDLAVRMTLMETHIINETKRFLAQEGVVIDKIGGKGIERSGNVILVKNIPHKTTVKELDELFSKFGELARVLLTPARTLALIEYYHVSEAKQGFRNLAYTRFHHVPMFLEWAPIGIFNKAAPTIEERDKQRLEAAKKQEQEEKQYVEQAIKEEKKENNNNNKKEQSYQQQQQQQPEIDDSKSFYVYVKNLSFDTSNESLVERFKKLKDYVTVNIATKVNPKTGEKQSHGYAFAQFASKAGAHECIKRWNGATIDGHEISIKFSDKNAVSAASSADKRKQIPESAAVKPGGVQASNKIIVKNVAFEATQRDIRKLFATYGELSSVRLPNKPTGGHKGYAFVEYLTEQEAKNAMDALQSSHLYGRHLVLDYAEQDKNIDQLRQKASESLEKIQGKPSRY